MAKPSPTIYEVAREAGVSIATVSRVHKGAPGVSANTRNHVQRVIDEMRYTPSALARGLAERRHGAIGLVFPNLAGPYYGEVTLGYEEQSVRDGNSVLILGTHGRERADALVLDLASRVDGLVIMGRTVADETVARLVDSGVPVVVLARVAPGADSVRAENRSSARALTEHLLGHGYRRIAFLGDWRQSPDVTERWQGYVEAHRAAGLPEPDDAVTTGWGEEEGHRAASAVLAARPDVEALVGANDEIALGAVRAVWERGLVVGRDVAVTGWDDILMARFLEPGLTTVRQPMRELGSHAARALTERITGARAEPRDEVLPTELVIRASCGCQDHRRRVG